MASRRGPKSANERLRRLLVMLPWIMERGEVSVADVAERFAMTEEAVIADLERASMCGLPPFEPGDLIDLFIDDGVVYAGPPKFFTRPLRLTAPEGFALLVAGRASLQLPGADPEGPLARSLDKLAARLGAAGLEVDLPKPALAEELARAVEEHAQLRIRYWSGRSEELSERVMDPLVLFTDRGLWYVLADDHLSGEERYFRIDRIESAERTGATFTGRAVVTASEGGWFTDHDLPRVTLRLTPAARWVAERYPADSVTPVGDGEVEVVMPVTSEAWLARLLVRAAASVRVVAPPEWEGLGRATAERVLARYRSAE
jgi:proteasome accessory factor C